MNPRHFSMRGDCTDRNHHRLTGMDAAGTSGSMPRTPKTLSDRLSASELSRQFRWQNAFVMDDLTPPRTAEATIGRMARRIVLQFCTLRRNSTLFAIESFSG